jgi:hypothetical protein
MSRNGTVKTIENNIPVMDFVSLNKLLDSEYPGYRIKSNYFDVAGSLLSMSGANTLTNLRKNTLSQFDNEYLYFYKPPEDPMYPSREIKLQN